MTDISKINYHQLDRPEILQFVFHPRPEMPFGPTSSFKDFLIPTEPGIAIGARFHMADSLAANLLFFHGNGEIVADYDDLGPVYNKMGLNFLPVDYRGYGRSTGMPTVTGMMRDCHLIFDFIKKWLHDSGNTGPMIVMGRSLGSASALELAASYREQIDALIIESGFAYATPLLRLLGINTAALGIKEEEGFRNIDKISKFDKPTLIIHAEYDHIIPFADGQALYDVCPSPEKSLLKIPHANHNDIFARGLKQYLAAMKSIAELANRERT